MSHRLSFRLAQLTSMSTFGPNFGDAMVVEADGASGKKRKGVTGSQAPRAGASGSGGETKIGHQAILALSAKVRDLQTCSIRAAAIDGDHRSVKYMMSTQKQHADAVKGNTGHNCGTLDWWSFCWLAKAMHEEVTSEASKKVCAELLALVDQEAGVRKCGRLPLRRLGRVVLRGARRRRYEVWPSAPHDVRAQDL